MSTTPTIAAIATAVGPAGVGIVRLSGPDAFPIASRVVRRDLARQPHQSLRRATAFSPEGEALDDGLVAVFRAPHSFTGEDIVEFQGHGGTVTLSRVLSAFLAAGAVPAGPGAFSERAFHHGKLDLAQAEALAALIAARSVTAQRAARRVLDGALSEQAHACADFLKEALARLEATIDFPEDVGELVPETVAVPLTSASALLEALLHNARYGRRLTEGLTIALTGAPNVGKSSLLNALAGAERAIVTPIPGTTRDILSESLVLDGLPTRVLDTAGLRETDDPIEQLGVARARAALTTADVVVTVVDVTAPDLPSAPPTDAPWVIALNKADLTDPEPIRATLAQRYPQTAIVALSALRKVGIDALTQAIVHAATGATPGDHEAPLVTQARHEDALRRALAQIAQAQQTLTDGLPAELIAVDLHGALASLGELTGETTRDDIIAGIFSRFCIGK